MEGEGRLERDSRRNFSREKSQAQQQPQAIVFRKNLTRKPLFVH